MVFHEWRGHVRFFTEGDLRKLLECAGGRVVECRLHEVLYNSVPERYFVQPNVAIPGWRASLLTEFPALRNEILMVAEKPRRAAFNPFDVRAQAGEFQTLSEEFVAGRSCRKDRPTLQDLAFGARAAAVWAMADPGRDRAIQCIASRTGVLTGVSTAPWHRRNSRCGRWLLSPWSVRGKAALS